MSAFNNHKFETKLKEWYVKLNNYTKYNVKLYELKPEYNKELSNPKIHSKLIGNCDLLFSDEDFKDVDNIKSNIVSILEKNGNVRAGIYIKFMEKYDYFLLSSYEENEYYDIRAPNMYDMYDDAVYVIYYIVRYPMLDTKGYYSLSGMTEFDKEDFFKKYNMDMTKQPYRPY